MAAGGGFVAERLEEGRVLFNAGRFFEAHEKWEEAWLAETGPSRLLLQGLIQIAAGFLKAASGNVRAAVHLLDAGLGRLAATGTPPELVDFADDVRRRTESLREPGSGVASWPLLPPLPSVK